MNKVVNVKFLSNSATVVKKIYNVHGLSYFSIAVTKNSDQRNLQKEFNGALQFQRGGIHDHHGREHGSKQGGK